MRQLGLVAFQIWGPILDLAPRAFGTQFARTPWREMATRCHGEQQRKVWMESVDRSGTDDLLVPSAPIATDT